MERESACGGSDRVKDFRELRVYKTAFDLAADLHEISKRFPSDERYGLTSQMRHASRSVCANIAEAWRRRRSVRHVVSKRSDADAAAAETSVWLDLARQFDYLDEAHSARLSDACDRVARQLALLIQSPDPWLQNPRP